MIPVRLRRWLRTWPGSLAAAFVIAAIPVGAILYFLAGVTTESVVGAVIWEICLTVVVAAIAKASQEPRPLKPFANDRMGIIIDTIAAPEPFRNAIRRAARGRPLENFLEIQLADGPVEWPTESDAKRETSRNLRQSLNAWMLLKEIRPGELKLIVVNGPRIVSDRAPRVLYAEVYEWPLSSSRPTHAGSLVSACALYRREFYEAIPDLGSTPEETFLKGCSLLKQWQPQAAADLFNQTRVDWDRRLYPDLWGRVTHNIGAAFLSLNPREAETHLRNAWQVRDRTSYPSGWASTANNLALALHLQHKTSEALQLLTEAYQALKSKDFPAEAAAVQANIELLERSEPPRPQASTIPAEIAQTRIQIRDLIDIPREPFSRPGIRIAHRLVQATTVSGDFYRFYPRRDGSVGMTLVDVEGHGLAASGTALAVEKALSRSGVNWGMGDPRLQLEQADALVEEELSHAGVAVCMNFTEVDPYKKKVRYAGAGMPFPLLFRYRQSQPEVLTAVGMYVGGGYRRTRIRPALAQAQLEDGDVILIFTDGIPEAVDSRGRTFGQNGIAAAVLRAGWDSAEAIADEVLRAAREHSGKPLPDDDQALLVVQVGEPPAEGPFSGVPTFSELPADPPCAIYELLNAEDSGQYATTFLKQRLVEVHSLNLNPPGRGLEVWNAVWEGIQNAIKHGSSPGDVLRIDVKPDVALETLEVIITQPRRWLDWDLELGSRRSTLELSDKHGFGTLIMLRLAQSVLVSDNGRRIHLKFARTDRSDAS